MDSKKNRSSFQFSNPSTKEAVFVVNPKYKGTLSNVKSQDFVVKTKVEKPSDMTEDLRTARVFVTVTNTEDDFLKETTPFLLRVTMSAKFQWAKAGIEQGKEQTFLKVNGASLIMSYIRPIITQLTEQADVQTQYLPFLNFTK
ncbi:Preprotein translocase subunit SecB [Lentilactobacillus parabuchneri]|uniref:protein-export chaperone SecB n=1 Tax=Lentilactobacillus TaxID=2767893 RepID=UPI000A11C74E|nr:MULTISPECIES: protein-export chaperone SecB [Lentilactobacillus]MCP9369188.1 protein-export chaperone SecB [Lentilactobacillus kefiri]ORN25126.1 Preprotein translocase subunit SecB [Lentilactobacillus parabuchneri]